MVPGTDPSDSANIPVESDITIYLARTMPRYIGTRLSATPGFFFPIMRETRDEGEVVVIDASTRTVKPKFVYLRPQFEEKDAKGYYKVKIEVWVEDARTNEETGSNGLSQLSEKKPKDLWENLEKKLKVGDGRNLLPRIKAMGLEIEPSEYANNHLTLKARFSKPHQNRDTNRVAIYDALVRFAVSSGLQ